MRFIPFCAFLLALLTPAYAASPAKTSAPADRKNAKEPVEKTTQPKRLITLEEAYDRTLATDQSIRTAWYGIRRANLQPWSALTRLGPSLTGNASYQGSQRINTYEAVGLEGPETFTTRNNTHTRFAGFTLVQPLFDPTVIPAYRYGKLSAQAARLQYRFTIRQTLFGVSQAYYDVLKLQKIVEINALTVELAKQQLIDATNRFEVGAVARVDVLRAEASMEEARNQMIQAQGMLELNLDTLSNILNFGGKTDFTLVEPPNAPDPQTTVEAALERAFSRREDFKISAIGVEQEKTRRQEIIASYSPRISAQASTQWTSNSGAGSGRTQVNSGVISVQVPFLTGGQREIDLRASRYHIEESKLSLETAEKIVEADVKNAWVQVRTGREAIESLKAAVEAATKNYEDVQSFYESGASTSLDVQVALRELNNTQTMLTNQLYNYQVALRDLQRAQALFEDARVQKKSTLK